MIMGRSRVGQTKYWRVLLVGSGDRGETHFAASSDVQGASITCAAHGRSLEHDPEGIAVGQRWHTQECFKVISRDIYFERFCGFWEIISRLEFDVRRCGKCFLMIRFLVCLGFNYVQ